METSKRCPRCKEDKPTSDFYKDKYKKDGLRYSCKACSLKQAKKTYHKRRRTPGMVGKIRKKARKYYAEHKDQARQSRNRWKYGLEPEQRLLMYADQKGCCAICGEAVSYNRIHTDHDHKTGEVRGLLCGNCNLMLGHARDDIKVLELAAVYLKKK